MNALPDPDFEMDGGTIRCYYQKTVEEILRAEQARIRAELMKLNAAQHGAHNYYHYAANVIFGPEK